MLEAYGINESNITVVEVPGAFEIPFALDRLASGSTYNALIAIGCVIKGETAHFEYISESVMDGIARVSAAHNIPIACGVLTTYTDEQAIARSSDNEENKGSEAALAAIEMGNLAIQLS